MKTYYYNMSSNFKFLKNFNRNLYILADTIEKEIYTAPSAVLADGTTFLENLIFDIFKRVNHELDLRIPFADKVEFLAKSNYISINLKKNLLRSYRIRNSMHSINDNVEDHLKLNKLRAVNMHKYLFISAWLYYDEFCDDIFKSSKPSYIHPDKINKGIFNENNIEIKNCIACGTPLGSKNSLFCPHCKEKLHKSDELKSLRKSIGSKTPFKKDRLIELGYSKELRNQLLIELRNEGYVKIVGRLNYFNNEKINELIKETDQYRKVENTLYNLNSRNLSLEEVRNSECYELGKKGIAPFVEIYKIISKLCITTFLRNFFLKESFDNLKFDIDIVYQWYNQEKTSFSLDFKKFNQILINNFLKLKRAGRDNEEIKKELFINEDIWNYWKTSDNELFVDFFENIKEIKYEIFLKELRKGNIREDALKIAEITEEDLSDKLANDDSFNKKFNEQYVEKRSNKFIHYLNQESIETSAVKSKLSIEEVNQWVEKGRKTREEPFKSFCLKYTKALMDKYLRLLRKTDIENAFVNSQIKRDDLDSWIRKGQRQYDDSNDMFITFYSKLTKILLNKYVEARKNGKRKKEAAKEIGKTVESVKNLLDNKMNEECRQKLEKIKADLIIDSFKEGKTKEETILKVDISLNELNEYLELGKDEESQYHALYEEYSKSLVPNLMKKFLKEFETKQQSKVLKSLKITEKDLENWCKIEEDEENPITFYDSYMEIKKEKYISNFIKKGSKLKALKNSDMTNDEFMEFEEELNDEIRERQMLLFLKEIIKHNKPKQAARKVNIKLNDAYEWYVKGLEGDNEYTDFSEIFYDAFIERILVILKNLTSEGESEGNIVKFLKYQSFMDKEDYKFLKNIGTITKDENNRTAINIERERNLFNIHPDLLDLDIELNLMDE